MADGRLAWSDPFMVPADRFVVCGPIAFVRAIASAREAVKTKLLAPTHRASVSLRAPMQCTMKGMCARCLVLSRDPATGEEKLVYACAEPHQDLDRLNLQHVEMRQSSDSVHETLTEAWLERVIEPRDRA